MSVEMVLKTMWCSKTPIITLETLIWLFPCKQTYNMISFKRKPAYSYIASDKTVFIFNQKLIFFFLLHENVCCGYSLEVLLFPQKHGYSLEMPHWGTSNEYPRFCGKRKIFSWYFLLPEPMYTVTQKYIAKIIVWCFTSLSTLFKSYRDDGRLIWSAIQSCVKFHVQWVLLDHLIWSQEG